MFTFEQEAAVAHSKLASELGEHIPPKETFRKIHSLRDKLYSEFGLHTQELIQKDPQTATLILRLSSNFWINRRTLSLSDTEAKNYILNLIPSQESFGSPLQGKDCNTPISTIGTPWYSHISGEFVSVWDDRNMEEEKGLRYLTKKDAPKTYDEFINSKDLQISEIGKGTKTLKLNAVSILVYNINYAWPLENNATLIGVDMSKLKEINTSLPIEKLVESYILSHLSVFMTQKQHNTLDAKQEGLGKILQETNPKNNFFILTTNMNETDYSLLSKMFDQKNHPTGYNIKWIPMRN